MTLPPEAPALPQRLVGRSSVLPNRLAILPLLPNGAAIAEVGVAFGDFSAAILETCQPRHFFAIDSFGLHDEQDLWGRTPAEAFGTATHRDSYEARFRDALDRGSMTILQGQSADCLDRLPAGSLDVVYVDADHRYEFVKRDLESALRAVRHDGWIIVNDYIMVPMLGATMPYGVVNATHEFMLQHDWALQHLALQTRMFCDVVLRPAHLLRDEADDLREELAAIRSSTCWRVTAPLRAVAGTMRRWKGRRRSRRD